MVSQHEKRPAYLLANDSVSNALSKEMNNQKEVIIVIDKKMVRNIMVSYLNKMRIPDLQILLSITCVFHMDSIIQNDWRTKSRSY